MSKHLRSVPLVLIGFVTSQFGCQDKVSTTYIDLVHNLPSAEIETARHDSDHSVSPAAGAASGNRDGGARAPVAAAECEGMPCIRQAAGTTLRYHYPLPADAALVFGVPSQPGKAATYEVMLDDGSSERAIFSGAGGAAQQVTIPLPSTSDLPARLSFSVRADSGAQAAEESTWTQPRIVVQGPARATPPSDREPRPSSLPNVVIYVMDAMRADHLEPYGYGRNVSPNIQDLAEQSIVFEHAYAHSVWTKPAVASLLTGLLPQEHLAIDDVSRLADSVATLATYLEEKGYTTIGLQANGNVGTDYGFDRDFDLFFDSQTVFPPDNKKISLSSRFIHERLLENVDRLREPFFLFIQSLDPHFPYEPEGEYRSYVEGHPLEGRTSAEMLEQLQKMPLRQDEEHARVLSYLIGLYDGDVRHNDSYVGKLIELLRARGVFDRTAFFLTADHGEGFHDHGYEVGHAAFFEHTVRVPLIYKPPDRTTGSRSTIPVQHLDIVPTILELVGMPAKGLRGTSLARLISSDGNGPPRPIHMVRFRDKAMERFRRDGRAVISWPWKLVREDLGSSNYRIFHLEKDPNEKQNLWQPANPDAERLLAYLLQEERKLELDPPEVASAPVEIRDSVREQLRQLGYLP